MRSFAHAVLFLLLLPGLLFVNNFTVASQDENWEIRITQSSLLEGSDTALLKLYFNIYDDRSGEPMPIVEADNVQVSLLNTGYTSPGILKKPDIPIYITLVLDSSGSMGGSAAGLQGAAKLALNNAPEDALFSIVQFDEEIKLLHDFSQNLPALAFAIDQYQVSQKGTCLYDAAYTAAEALARAPVGRRAVILFTDGKDETPEGRVCSKHTFQELLTFAKQNQVPIHTIGLASSSASLNEAELRGMAAGSGGFSAIASQDDLAAAFEKILQALKAQWMVEAPVYPRKGNNNAVFNLTLRGGKELNNAFSFSSETDYPGPPLPVSMTMAGLTLNPAQQVYEAQITITSPALAAYVKISVWDTGAGIKVGEYVYENPVDFNSFRIPTDVLGVKRDYELRIIAVSREDQTPIPIGRDRDGKTITEMVHPFSFDPTSAYPAIQIQSIVQDSGDLQLNVSVSNPALIGSIDGWLVNENTNTLVTGSNFTSPPINTGSGSILIPMRANRIPNGKYTVIVRVLSDNNTEYSRAEFAGLAYRAPSIVSRLGVAFVAAPIFLYLILALIMFVVAFLVFSSFRQKGMSATPVAQGQLGKKLGSGRASGGPVIAVADEEPIPRRSPPPSVAPNRQAQAPPASVHQVGPPVVQIGRAGMDAGATMIESAPVAMPRAMATVVKAPPGAAPQGPIGINIFPFVIGRQDSNLIITDRNVSRRHAQITFDAARKTFFVTDLNSSNGTYLNNQRLPAGQPVLIAGNAEISLGSNVSIRIHFS